MRVLWGGHQYHAIIALFSMSDNRVVGGVLTSFVYSSNTEKKRICRKNIASWERVCYNLVASGIELLKKATLRL
jgi:hypothetical protein